MSLIPVSARVLVRPSLNALPWDLFDRNGLLFASKGTPMRECDALFEDESRLFYMEERQARAAQQGLGAAQAAAAALPWVVDADENEELIARFLDVPKDSPVLAQLETWGLKLRSLFANPEPTSTWGYRMYRVGQAMVEFMTRHGHHVQLVLAVRSPYETVGYAGWHPMFRACLAYRAAKQWGATSHELEMLVCAALSADVSMYRLSGDLAKQSEPLTPAQREEVADHPAATTRVLRSASVVDPLWLYLTERHHTPPATMLSPQSPRRHVLQEIIRIADIITARASMRRDRPAVSLMTALAQASVDPATRQVSLIARHFANSMGVPPIGALVSMPDNAIAVVVDTRTVVPVTNGQFIPSLSFNRKVLSAADFKQLKPIPPDKVPQLRILLEKLANDVTACG